MATETREHDYMFKLLLLGDASCGKSALLARYVDDIFSDGYAATVGVDFKTKTLQKDGKLIKLQIWDTAGQERFRSITSAFYRRTNGIMLVYDLTTKTSLEHAERWIQEIGRHADEFVVTVLIGNKSDLSANRVVSIEDVENFAMTHGLTHLETSAATGENVVEAFDEMLDQLLRRRAPPQMPPMVCYGPPPQRNMALKKSCCHHLGPPGNLFHVGTSADRGMIAKASLAFDSIPSWSSQEEVSAAASMLQGAIRSGMPVVLRHGQGLLSPGVADELSTDALATRFMERILPIAELREGLSIPPFRFVRMPLGVFLNNSLYLPECEDVRRRFYLQQVPVEEYLPELETLGLPLYGPEMLREAVGDEILVTCTYFCGCAGVRTSLHFDRGDYSLSQEHANALSSIDNLFLQLSGKKLFRLFRPADHDACYARGARDPDAPHVSQIENTSNVDVDRFPLFADAFARSFEVKLGPGDALYIPRWWWHQSTTLKDGHAVNWWFESFGPKHAEL